MVFALCSSYDENYCNNNAPRGIVLISKSDSYEAILEKLRETLIKRQTMDEDYGCGWSKEYRLCVLETEDNNSNKIKKILVSDFRNNNFWDEQIKKFTTITEGR